METFTLDGYVVVYSLTDKTSFETAIDILDSLRQEVGPEKAVILTANKSDLVRKRRVSAEGNACDLCKRETKVGKTYLRKTIFKKYAILCNVDQTLKKRELKTIFQNHYYLRHHCEYLMKFYINTLNKIFCLIDKSGIFKPIQ